MSSGRPFPRPLSDRELRDALGRRFPGGGSWRITGRRSFKSRRDWRGARLFERVTVEAPHRPPMDLCLKYFAPLPGSRPTGDGARREARVYRVLNQYPVAGAPVCYGLLGGAGPDRSVLVLEYVRGRRLKKIASPAMWRATAEWLGRFHAELAAGTSGTGTFSGLPRRDGTYFHRWARRAASLAHRRCGSRERGRLEALVRGYGPVASALAGGRVTLVHGELYCTNVLVREEPGGARFCPFDWETAGTGCGTLDVAYLGRQKLGVEREDLLAAYAEGWARTAGSVPDPRSLRVQHAAARVHERVYMLWSACAHRGASPAKVAKYLDKLDRLMGRLVEAGSGGAGG